MSDLWAALCLVLVIEGLMLFVAPQAWQQMVRRALEIEPRQLRVVGGVTIVIGLIALQLVRI